jgi:hypothetical protein
VPPVLPTESKPQYGHKTAALRAINPGLCLLGVISVGLAMSAVSLLNP